MKTVSTLLSPLSPICSAIDIAYGLHSASAIVMEGVLVKGKLAHHRFSFLPRGYGGSRAAFEALTKGRAR